MLIHPHIEPTCIVFPSNTSDVITAMKAIHAFDSHYAVRGGGHSAMPLWNTYYIILFIQEASLIRISAFQKAY